MMDLVKRRLKELELEAFAAGKIVEDLCDRVKSLEECGIVRTTRGREAAVAEVTIKTEGANGPFDPWESA